MYYLTHFSMNSENKRPSFQAEARYQNYSILLQVYIEKYLVEEQQAAKAQIEHLVPEWYKAKGSETSTPIAPSAPAGHEEMTP